METEKTKKELFLERLKLHKEHIERREQTMESWDWDLAGKKKHELYKFACQELLTIKHLLNYTKAVLEETKAFVDDCPSE